MQAWPMRSQTAQETGMTLHHNWFTVHGVPERVHSDLGGNFESMLFPQMATPMGYKKTTTTAYHPTGNGDVERNNRSIIAMLKNYVQQDPQSWDRSLPAICFAYNSSCREETRVLPQFLLTGRDLRLPGDLMTSKPSFLPSTNAIAVLQERMRLVHEVVKPRLENRRNLMKELYDQKASANTAYNVGDLVMLRNSVLQNDESRKFHLPYCGPCRAVEVLPPVIYVIESLDWSTTEHVHFNRLKKSCGRINEKSMAENDKLKGSSRNDWPNSDIGFCRRFSQSQSHLSRNHNSNSRRPNLRPRSMLRRPHYYPDV